MKTLLLIIACLHGCIHLIGGAKSFGWLEVKSLTTDISKPFGVLWLASAVLLISYGLLQSLDFSRTWVIGLLAIVTSQLLIIYFWNDTKYGTIINLILLTSIVSAYGEEQFRSKVQKETQPLFTHHLPPETLLTIEEINTLPTPVQRWLLGCGAVGQPKQWNGKITQKALMQMKPAQDKWFKATATQYTSIQEPSFIWSVNMKMNPFLWFLGRDKFINGTGEMLIKMNGLLTVADESGEKIDEGSLQRYLGEMVWFPSLAISPYIEWEEVDEQTAIAHMSINGTKGSGTFHFDQMGNFVRFQAWRYQGNEPNSEKKEWILTVQGYERFQNIKIPAQMEAMWKLDSMDWTWLQLEILDMEYNFSLKN